MLNIKFELIPIKFGFFLRIFKFAPKSGQSPCTISNAVALLSRIHPSFKWLPQLLQPCYSTWSLANFRQK